MSTLIISTTSSWENLTELEQLAQIYSDQYKSAHGFRPRGGGHPTTVDGYVAALECLDKQVQEQIAEDAQRQARRLEALEAEFAELQLQHRIGRADAIRWWLGAQGYEASSCLAQDRQAVDMILWDYGLENPSPELLTEMVGE